MRRRSALKLSLTVGVLLATGTLHGVLAAAKTGSLRVWSVAKGGYIMVDKVFKTPDEWRRQLTAEQYHVTREQGTERAFTGAYWNNHEKGTYRCAGCGAELFVSDSKFDSGCGWPSFQSPAAASTIATNEDRSHSMVRTEVTCARCGGAVRAAALRTEATSRASPASEMTSNLSPGFGRSERPVICTGVEGPASSMRRPCQSRMDFTVPLAEPARILSPRRRVPYTKRANVTGPQGSSAGGRGA